MTAVEHVLSGVGAPSVTPPSLGAHYTDTQADTLYIAAGVETSEDWRPVYSDSGWITLPALNGFEHPPEARRLNGVVYLRGFIWVETSELNEPIAQLPVGWRPGVQLSLIRANANHMRQLNIPGMLEGDGEISVSIESGENYGAFFQFDGISFPVG